MTKRKTILMICGVMMMTIVSGQDLHFSQFMNSPLTTNPANTGFMPEGDYRIGINYRNQWSSIMQVPYKTMGAFGVSKNLPSNWSGILSSRYLFVCLPNLH